MFTIIELNDTVNNYIIYRHFLTFIWMRGSVRLNIGDSSLFLLDSAIEDNNYVLIIYILGELAKLFEL